MREKLIKASALKKISVFILTIFASGALAGDGKLLATAGLSQVEGSGGGGLVPWATLSGYDSRDQISASVFSTRVELDDYQLDVQGLSLSLYDRVELSLAQQQFAVPSLNTEIEQNIFGAKVRLYGDAV